MTDKDGVDFYKRKARSFYQQRIFVQMDLKKMTRKYEEAQQKCKRLQQEVDFLTVPIDDRFEILDL